MGTTPLHISEVLDLLSRAAAPAEKRQECVLLIEDSEDAMILVQCALQEYGQERYRLAWESNLSEGLAQLSKGGVDVVLLDLGLPESNGPENYAAVRQAAPRVPVVVVTADDSTQTEREVLASGAEDYLIKHQISGPLLLQAIQAAISANKRPRDWSMGAQEPPQRFRKKSGLRSGAPSLGSVHQ